MCFGVNHLGHFLLTNTLLPRLRECAPSRVVTLTCSNYKYQKLDFQGPQLQLLPFFTYCQQQAGQHLLHTGAGAPGRGKGVSRLCRAPSVLDWTDDGFSMCFGVNHLGHFLLTNTLLPRLRECAPSRVVTLTCSNYKYQKLDFQDLNYNLLPFFTYCRSKLANIYFTQELARLGEAKGVSAYAVHPAMPSVLDWTDDGFSMCFGVNHLGHFLLTNTLLPRLRECAPSRVVTLTCSNYKYQKLDFQDLNYNLLPFFTYCRSKLANIYFTQELARLGEAKGSGWTCHYSILFRMLMQVVMWMFFVSCELGAQTVVYCARVGCRHQTQWGLLCGLPARHAAALRQGLGRGQETVGGQRETGSSWFDGPWIEERGGEP
ncbi:hypothetical protein CRUP_038422 [Coryphaenoides rupestris]|nr:hypothetical protein CRUP_038422 [Coryphaenoides rupestris]